METQISKEILASDYLTFANAEKNTLVKNESSPSSVVHFINEPNKYSNNKIQEVDFKNSKIIDVSMINENSVEKKINQLSNKIFKRFNELI